MDVKPIDWLDDYNVGEQRIDDAHKKLFMVMRHILAKESLESDNVEYSCSRVVSFFKKYTIQHFSEEEAFMRSINYPGYEMHKRLHDNIREVVLPKIEADLIATNYSDASVYRLVSTLSGWLSGHILIEDRAITGKVDSKYSLSENMVVNSDLLDMEFEKFMHDLFRLKAKCINKFYTGERLEKTHCFELIFENSNKQENSFLVIVEKSLLLFMMSKMLGITVTKIDADSLISFVEVMISVGRAAYSLVYPTEEYLYTGTRPFLLEQFHEKYSDSQPHYSMLWSTEKGLIGLVFDK